MRALRYDPPTMRAKDLGNILILAAMLGGLLWFTQAGGDSCAGAAEFLAAGPAAPDPEEVIKALEAAASDPVAGRLDVHFEWIARGSPLAIASLETWLNTFPAGSLTKAQIDELADVALAWSNGPLRTASAGVLLANSPQAASAPAWRLVRGEEVAGDREQIADTPWAAALGRQALPALLKRADDGPLRQLLRAHPDLRRQAIPQLIEGLPATHPTLAAVAATDLGTDPDPWRQWWAGVESSLKRFAD